MSMPIPWNSNNTYNDIEDTSKVKQFPNYGDKQHWDQLWLHVAKT